MIELMLVYVDVSFTYGECGFNSLGSWYYSKELCVEYKGKKYIVLLQGNELSTG